MCRGIGSKDFSDCDRNGAGRCACRNIQLQIGYDTRPDAIGIQPENDNAHAPWYCIARSAFACR
jgi:hypothetical protein